MPVTNPSQIELGDEVKRATDDVGESDLENLDSEFSDAVTINYLTERNAVFTRTSGKMLNVTVDGVLYPNVFLHCSFPHTDKTIYISVRTGEDKEIGKEIGMIKAMSDFPADVIRLLEEQINIRYFAPVITTVVSIKEEFGYSYWETETTAGLCRFTVRSGGGNVKPVGEQRLLVMDVDGNRFIIPDLEQLSAKEYRMVEMCL